MRIGVYPGTFDPITNGHVDIIKRCLMIFDQIIVAVAPNPEKQPLFNTEDRVGMIQEACRGIPHLQVERFDSLLVDYANAKGAVAVIRGLRAVSDFEYELQMALMNQQLDPKIQTVFMMPSQEFTYLTSSIVKGVARHGGEIKGLVPDGAIRELKRIFRKAYS